MTQGDFITYMGGWDGWMAVPSWDGTLLFCCLKLLCCCQVRSQISGAELVWNRIMAESAFEGKRSKLKNVFKGKRSMLEL